MSSSLIQLSHGVGSLKSLRIAKWERRFRLQFRFPEFKSCFMIAHIKKGTQPTSLSHKAESAGMQGFLRGSPILVEKN